MGRRRLRFLSFFLPFFLSFFLPFLASAQPTDVRAVEALEPVPQIPRNGIANLHAQGDSLWIGPLLTLTTDGGQTFLQSTVFEDLSLDPRLRIYSLDIEGQTIWAGLGYSVRDASNETINVAGGFLVSEDGGTTWRYYQPPLDPQSATTETYGVSTLPALPVVAAENSPPWDVDYDPEQDVVWTAGFASGVRRATRVTTQTGTQWQWERVVLPPDSLDEISPDQPYTFMLSPLGSAGNEGLNFRAFSVLVDETGTVWAGTAGGLNRSTDADSLGADASWRKYGIGGQGPDELPGNFIVSIEEQPLPGRNPVWIASRPAGPGEQFGITVTRDGGETFETVYLGTPVFDFAFRGTTIYAAGEREGLLISEDDGRTWRTIRDFRDPDRPGLRLPPSLEVFAVATTRDALWLGTSEGLLKSADGGQTWDIFRAFVAPDEEAGVYVYPNPFSPSADHFARIVYELDQPGSVRVRIFDFGMNLVRDLVNGDRPMGPNEEAWDGTSDDGLRVANGTYFYAVETPAGTHWGKLLVLK